MQLLQEEKPGDTVVNKEKTTHLSIHTVHLDGLRELYRHFLVAPDGAIVEVRKTILQAFSLISFMHTIAVTILACSLELDGQCWWRKLSKAAIFYLIDQCTYVSCWSSKEQRSYFRGQ